MEGLEKLKSELLEKIPELGEYLSLSIANGLTKNDKYVVEAFKGMLEKLKYQRDFDLISEAEYYRNLEILRDRYFSKGTQNWVKYTEEIYEYQKELLETERKNITELYTDVADFANKRLDAVMKKHQAAAKEINSFGGLFNVNTVKMNGVTDTYTTLHDLEYDIDVIKRYADTIEQITKRAKNLGVSDDASEGLLSAINGLGVEEALGFGSALMRANDTDFAKYANDLQLKKALSEGIAANRYEKEFSDAWDESYNNMKKKLADAGYEIPEDFFVSGSISAQKFGEAFLNGLDTQLEAIREKVREFSASLDIGLDLQGAGNTYNTTNTSYNIQSSDSGDTVEQIKRIEALKRLSGIV